MAEGDKNPWKQNDHPGEAGNPKEDIRITNEDIQRDMARFTKSCDVMKLNPTRSSWSSTQLLSQPLYTFEVGNKERRRESYKTRRGDLWEKPSVEG